MSDQVPGSKSFVVATGTLALQDWYPEHSTGVKFDRKTSKMLKENNNKTKRYKEII